MLRRIMAGLITLICAVCWQAAHAQITEPKIMPRKSWETKKAATDRMLAQAPPYKGIVIHNTAASQAKLKANKKLTTEQRIRNIQNGHQTENFHKYRPEMKGKTWGDFAYHYYIAMDGQIAETRSIG